MVCGEVEVVCGDMKEGSPHPFTCIYLESSRMGLKCEQVRHIMRLVVLTGMGVQKAAGGGVVSPDAPAHVPKCK